MFYKNVVHKILSNFARNLTKKEPPTQMYFCEFSETLKNTYLAGDLQMAGSGFCTVLYVSFHNSFHQLEQHFLNVFSRISISENYCQKKKLDSKMQLFFIFSSDEHDLKSFIRAWEPA